MALTTIDQFLGLKTDTPASKCPQDYSPDCADIVFSVGGFSTRNPFRVELTMPAQIVFDESFTGRDGNTYRVVADVNGAIWSVAGGIPTQIDSVAPGSSVTSVAAYGRLYMAFFNALGGCDAPRSWDGTNIFRVAQGGPGAAATFSPSALSSDRYPIVSITQPAKKTQGFSYFLQSDGPGSTSPGNTVTFYYLDSTVAPGPDADLVAAFNSNFPVYLLASFVGGGGGIGDVNFGPQVVLVTSVSIGKPPGQPREYYYFTFEITGAPAYNFTDESNLSNVANYQRSLAKIITGIDVPDLAVGDTITVSNSSVPAWNSNWPVAQTPLSGEMVITQTSLIGGTATFNYSLSSGVAPSAGQTITVTNTFNAGGILNVTNGAIATATGGATGSFTITGFAGSDFPGASETGTGITAGTEFLIDPGLPLFGLSTSPIYGNSIGGFLVFAGTTATISSGQRLGVVFFINDNDSNTAPSPIATFFIPANTNAITVSNLPIGPANVKQRGVAFTPANGSRFFYMDLPASVNGVITGTNTIVNDNTSDTATFQFSDDALQAGIAIDIPGNNQFQQVTLDTPSGVEWFDDRLLWWGGKNKVTSLINMEMDGGTLSGSLNPLGWTVVGASGAIQQIGSAPAYVVTGPGTGEINQQAATTATYGASITQPNQPYLLRLWTNGTSGSAVGTLSSASTGFSSTAIIALTPGYVQADFTANTPAVIPSDLIFSFKITRLAAGVPAAVRDLQLIYANNPNRNPKARSSYTANPEAYDQQTGNIGPNDDNTELRAAFVLEESFHFLTAKALYYVSAIGNSEPSSWDPKQISDQCGAFDSNSVDTGQGWAVWAGPLGFFKYGVWAPGYFGGLPENLANGIFPTWKTLAGVSRVFNDSSAQRVYIPTGTQMLVLDYHELLTQGPAKWTTFKRAVNWASDSGFSIAAKVYELDTAAGTDDDDLGPIGGYYTFAPFAASMFQKQYDYLGFQITGEGPMTPFLYTKTLQDAPQALNMGELEDLIDTVAEWQSLGLKGRLLYLKLGQPGVQFSIESVASNSQVDPNAPVSGAR